jgi:hypothetical protein
VKVEGIGTNVAVLTVCVLNTLYYSVWILIFGWATP